MTNVSPIVYEASVFQQEVKYTNFKGQSFTDTLYFALDPLGLMEVIATFEPKANKKSNNPARRGQVEPVSFTDEQQLKFVRDLCTRAAGFPSEDGNSWTPFENFNNDLAGKAFLTKLISSDDDRKQFVQKVIIDPFEAFVGFAEADPSNDANEVKKLHVMLDQLKHVFTGEKKDESVEDRRERLRKELEAIEGTDETPTDG